MTTDKNLTARGETQPATRREADPRWAAPAVDVYENKDEFLIVADLPGVSQEDVRINYERGRIDLEATWTDDTSGLRLVLGQALGGNYRRSFSVPGTIDVNAIGAELKDGVLFLKLPKSEQAKPRQIRVNAS